MTFSPRAISSSVLFAALVSGPASAIEPGVYECRIESAVGLTAVGRKFSLTEAPQTFRLQAVNAPIMPDELRKPPYSLQYYQAEEMPTISASVAE